MPDWVSKFLSATVDQVWGLPLVILLMGGGVWLVVVSRCLPLRGLTHAMRLLAGRFHHPGDALDPGQVTYYQALMNALAATVGMGNIAGVAVAITRGGPGAIFWMWLAALIGMNTKFFECTTAVMFRGRDHRGDVQGGTMYAIDNALGAKWKPLAIMFAVCGLMGTTALFQINQTTNFVFDTYVAQPQELVDAQPPTASKDEAKNAEDAKPLIEPGRLVIGVVTAAIVAYVLIGGLKRLTHWTSVIVPFMCLSYVVMALVVIANHLERVPDVLLSIVTSAFRPQAALGGFEGAAVSVIFTEGVKRAAFSNEAGVGTAPMAHSNVKTSEPVSEGLVAMVGPLLDTIVICTMSALVILVQLTPDEYFQRDANGDPLAGVLLVRLAFERSVFGQFGVHLLGAAVILFGFSTMLGMANYNAKCWHYLFRGRWIFKQGTFIAFFCGTLIIGAVSAQGDVVNLLDIGYGLMAVPTMIATLVLAPRVKRALEAYLDRYCRKP